MKKYLLDSNIIINLWEKDEKTLNKLIKQKKLLILEEVLKELSVKELEKCLSMGVVEWYVLKGNIKKTVENYIYETTKRRPTIIPIIMET